MARRAGHPFLATGAIFGQGVAAVAVDQIETHQLQLARDRRTAIAMDDAVIAAAHGC